MSDIKSEQESCQAATVISKATVKVIRKTKQRAVKLTKKGMAMRSRIVNCAADLFHAHGTDGTSIDMILKTSQTGKSQFYHYFKSKEDLIMHVINAQSNAVDEACRQHFHRWDDLDDWVEEQLSQLQAFKQTRSCALGKMATDLDASKQEATARLNACFERLEGQIAAFLTEEAQSGRLAPHADIKALSAFFLAAQQGASLLAKISADQTIARKVMIETVNHLKSFRIDNRTH